MTPKEKTRMMQCVNCGTPLENDSDTFGDIHQPLCQECFFEIISDEGQFANYTWHCIDYNLRHSPVDLGVRAYTDGYQN